MAFTVLCLTVVRWVPVVFVVLLFVWSTYAYIIQMCLYMVTDLVERIFYLVIFSVLLFMCIWCFIKAIFTPTAGVPFQYFLTADEKDQAEKGKAECKEVVESKGIKLRVQGRTVRGCVRFCEACKCIKPDRTHHCSNCQKCVLKMDHHCPWINNCVSYSNYKFFFLFLTYSFLFCLFIAATSCQYFVKFWTSLDPQPEDDSAASSSSSSPLSRSSSSLLQQSSSSLNQSLQQQRQSLISYQQQLLSSSSQQQHPLSSQQQQSSSSHQQQSSSSHQQQQQSSSSHQKRQSLSSQQLQQQLLSSLNQSSSPPHQHHHQQSSSSSSSPPHHKQSSSSSPPHQKQSSSSPPPTMTSSSAMMANVNVLLLFVVSCCMGLAIFVLWFFHVELVAKNQTTLESLRAPVFRSGPDKNAYNRGCRKNFIEVFGRSPLLWLLPVFTDMGDGVTFTARISPIPIGYRTMDLTIAPANSNAPSAINVTMTPKVETQLVHVQPMSNSNLTTTPTKNSNNKEYTLLEGRDEEEPKFPVRVEKMTRFM